MSFLNTANTSGDNKPAILCLHGGGTNSTIFNVQTIRIQRVLAAHFSFVFIDGPYETGPGPGVLPFFEGCDPYFRWISTTGQLDMPEKTKALLLKTEEQQRKKDGRGFVGVMGFSQGGRAAAGLLLLEQQQRKERGQLDNLRFGVFLNSVAPPMAYGLPAQDLAEPIDFPSLHVVGSEDPWKESGERLWSEYFDQEKGVLFEFKVSHRLPTLEEDTSKIAMEILRLHRETSASEAQIG